MKGKIKEIIKKLKELPAVEDDSAWKTLCNPKHWGVSDSSKRIDEFMVAATDG